MKTRFFLCTRLWYFLTEIPLILLLCITIANHDSSTELLKLYPLEIVTACGMALTFLYFFRTATLTPLAIKKFGVFSEREEHSFSVGERLVLLLDERGYLHITVEGEDDAPTLSWCKSDRRHRTLFRTRVIFAHSSAASVLSLFLLNHAEADAALSAGDYHYQNESVSIIGEDTEHGRKISLTLLNLPEEKEVQNAQ